MEHNLTGDQVFLEYLTQNDVDQIFQWLKDEEFKKLLFYQYYPPKSEKIIEEINKSCEEKKNHEFMIFEKNTKEKIGWAGIYEIDKICNNGEIRFFIGNKNFWGKGFGTEVVKLLLDLGFKKFKLHRIYGGANIENFGSIKIFEKLNFVKEGISREAFFKNGKYYDLVHFGLINSNHLP